MDKLKYGQSFVDKVMSAKHTLSGQEMMKAVFKATTEEMMGSKRKHLDYLIMCTNDDTIDMQEMSNTLMQRALNVKWVVVFKALITVHDLMNYGNERFYQYIASSNNFVMLTNFIDKSDGLAFHMSAFIRRYARYIKTSTKAYRHFGYDVMRNCGKIDYETESTDWKMFVSSITMIKDLNDSLLRFEATQRDLTNGVINVAFFSLYKDFLKLYDCYKNYILFVIKIFFNLETKKCRDAFNIYLSYIYLVPDMKQFLKVAMDMGIDKSSLPNLLEISLDKKEIFEEHLKKIDSASDKKTFNHVQRSFSVDDEGAIKVVWPRSASEKIRSPPNVDNTDNSIDSSRRTVSLSLPSKTNGALNRYLIPQTSLETTNEADEDVFLVVAEEDAFIADNLQRQKADAIIKGLSDKYLDLLNPTGDEKSFSISDYLSRKDLMNGNNVDIGHRLNGQGYKGNGLQGCLESRQNIFPASNLLITQNNSQRSNTLCMQNSTPGSNNIHYTQNGTPGSNNIFYTQNNTPVSDNILNTQNNSLGFNNNLSTQNNTPGSINNLYTQNSTPGSNNIFYTQNSTPGSNNTVSTRNSIPISIHPYTVTTSNNLCTPKGTPESTNTSYIQNTTLAFPNTIYTQTTATINTTPAINQQTVTNISQRDASMLQNHCKAFTNNNANEYCAESIPQPPPGFPFFGEILEPVKLNSSPQSPGKKLSIIPSYISANVSNPLQAQSNFPMAFTSDEKIFGNNDNFLRRSNESRI